MLGFGSANFDFEVDDGVPGPDFNSEGLVAGTVRALVTERDSERDGVGLKNRVLILLGELARLELLVTGRGLRLSKSHFPKPVGSKRFCMKHG